LAALALASEGRLVTAPLDGVLDLASKAAFAPVCGSGMA
jgi:hypothetical protein